uniref:ParB/RepB/Spo0J family partition protein n=1 Tax=Profundibacter amoris TaxID=2171755 RepID=UPI003899B579
MKLRPETFQFREFQTIESHVFELGQTLKSGRELDPMLVWDRGKDGYIIIDGHHRYETYRICKLSAKISVRVFSGTEEEAVLLALEDNAKVRLPMTAQEKSNAAWRLVCSDYDFSKADICIATGISGPVPLWCRSGCSFKRPFVQKPMGFSSPVPSVCGAGYRSH